MSYIETKIECSVCKGKGNFYPLSTFNFDHTKKIECPNCDGLGHRIHLTPINPIIDTNKDEKLEYVPQKDAEEMILKKESKKKK
jgi:excinuclease UvrABC ATPase subunit